MRSLRNDEVEWRRSGGNDKLTDGFEGEVLEPDSATYYISSELTFFPKFPNSMPVGHAMT